MPRNSAERLQKALAHLGLASRREVEAWIRAGRLTVNGARAALGTRVRETDQVRLDGRLVRRRPAPREQVFICHRSPGEWLDRPRAAGRIAAGAGASRASSEPAQAADARAPLLEHLPRSAGRRFVVVSPMPLQDGGLELVTSDGVLAGELQRAVHGLVAEFSVRVRGELLDSQLRAISAGELEHGVRLEVIACSPAGGEGTNRWYSICLKGASGKDLRSLFEHHGAVVSRVLRTRLGAAVLDRTLPRGRARKLRPPELEALLAGTSDTGNTGNTGNTGAAGGPGTAGGRPGSAELRRAAPSTAEPRTLGSIGRRSSRQSRRGSPARAKRGKRP
ncbi:MAG: S4 domain-containing protein [Steroidobacteraceae bacterium]